MIKKNETQIVRGDGVFCRALNAEISPSDRLCANCPLCSGAPLDCKYSEDGEEFPEFIDGIRWTERHSVFQKAMKYAAVAHKGMTRKGTDFPYIFHPMEAAMIASTVTDDPEIIASAALHDVVEDTQYTIDDIESEFGSRIASIVGHESEDKRPDLPPSESWDIRKREFLDDLRTAPYEARIVTLADKLSNMRSISDDFAVLGDALWGRFNQKDPARHGWYYTSIAEILSDLEDTDAWKEYDLLCRTVFGEGER